MQLQGSFWVLESPPQNPDLKKQSIQVTFYSGKTEDTISVDNNYRDNCDIYNYY